MWIRPQLFSPRLLRVTGHARRAALIPLPTASPWPKQVIFRVFAQKRGRPLFRGPKVLQLNSDSFCDYVRIRMEVIGHLWAELGFWFFPEKRWKYSRPLTFDRARIFWQVVLVQQPVQYSRDAAHISWAVLRADPTWGLHGGEATPSWVSLSPPSTFASSR